MDESDKGSSTLENYIYNWLESALDFGIKESEFWEMTLGELRRSIESKRRVEKLKAQERASFDYILADLIGKSVGRLYSSANKIPELSEVYPSLFDTEEIQEAKAKKRAELSALRFKLFADAHNQKILTRGVNN